MESWNQNSERETQKQQEKASGAEQKRVEPRVVDAVQTIPRKALSAQPVPLTESQRGIYFAWLENPESTMYNIPFTLHLPPDIEADKLVQAIAEVVQHHPTLFVAISMQEQTPVMLPGQYNLQILRSHADSVAAAEQDFIHPFALHQEALCRLEVCSTPEGIVFLMDMHHIILDGISVYTFLQQITEAYDGKTIPDEQMTLFDIAEKERNLKESPKYQEAQAFFQQQLADVSFDTEVLPDADGSEPPAATGFCRWIAPEELRPEDVEQFVSQNGITENALFLAAFAYTLAKFTGTQQSCFTTVSNGRHRQDLYGTVGMFVKMLPLHINIQENQPVVDFLREVQELFRCSRKQDCISFGELVKHYGVHSNIAFVYQGTFLSELHIGNHTVLPKLDLAHQDCQSDILGMLLKTATGYMLYIQYRQKQYSAGFMESLAETVFTVVKGMLNCTCLRDIPLLSAQAQEKLAKFNQTTQPYPLEATVQSVLEEKIARYPDNIALVYKEHTYTYREFDRLTKNLAAYIAGKNMGSDDFVAVLGGRTDAIFLAVWGVIRAGAAFQVLDASYPSERLQFMVDDSRARLLIADRAMRGLLTSYTSEVLYTDAMMELPDAPDFCAVARPENALTLIYTSGTTGRPKGCIIENRNLMAFYYNHQEIMQINADSRVASYASFGFDAGVMDIVTTPMTGATCYLIPDEIRFDLPKIEQFYCTNHITHGFMTTQLGRMFAQQTACPTLQAFLLGGEKLVPFQPQSRFRVINVYGPCETLIYVCHYEVHNHYLLQPIGKPNHNTKMYIADPQGRLLPIGACGELCIAGRQVSRGYLGLPEKTQEVFVVNPYSSAPSYERMYKSGDIARLLPDGNFDYVGRQDGQVKIRGFRVELTEIEEIIRRFDGVEDATVAAFAEPGGGKYIAAYVVSHQKLDIAALHDWIRSEKPAYMVPAVTMQIEAIPYTQNQKVNRRALPKPERTMPTGEKKKPATAVQQQIYEIVIHILDAENIGVTDDLFAAGLTSIGVLSLQMELNKAFHIPVRFADIRVHSSIEALEQFLIQNQKEETYQQKTDYPLMQNQMGIFLDVGVAQPNVRYNVPALFKISAKLDTEKLRWAVCQAIQAHPYIKAMLRQDDQGDVKIIRNDAAEPQVELQALAALPPVAELVRPFTLLDSPLYRAAVYETQAGNYLFFDIHHIIADGTSLGILLHDISAAYQNHELHPESFTGFEAALEEQSIRASAQYKEEEAYYARLLSGCNTECLPAKCPEKENTAPMGVLFSRSFAAVSEDISAYCRENRVAPNAFFNAVFSYTLSEFLHTDAVAYCTVYQGRNDARLADCFAMLVKTLPVCCSLKPQGTILEFVQEMQQQLLDSMARSTVPFYQLSRQYGLKPDLFFQYQGDHFVFDDIGGEPAQMLPLEIEEVKAPLAMEIFLENGIYRVQASYRTDYFCKELIASLTSSLVTAAAGFIHAERLQDVSIFSEEEKQHFAAMNATDMPFARIPAQAIFEKQVQLHPQQVAVRTAEAMLTYEALNQKANALAQALLRLGAGNGEIIGLILERSELVPIAEIGILKAGCAFLPMLPSYPDERLTYCLKDAGCRFVLSTQNIMQARQTLFSATSPCRVLDVETLLEEQEISQPEIAIPMEQLAYCIYTSGSTGTPKGVMIEQHNLSNFVQTSGLQEMIQHGSHILCMAAISFDMSLSEIFFSLCWGKTLYIATEEEIHNLDRLLTILQQQQIDLMMATPSFMWNLVSEPEFHAALAQLQGVVLGAEAFQPALLAKLKALNPHMVIQNGYGPTECTQACSSKTLTEGDSITIGRPFANMQFYSMDAYGNLLPRYAVGELMICGEGVCRGYVNLPDKNRAAFTEINGLRAYHSGDLVRVNRDNEAEFLGRNDNQIKVRGFRIELGEIETVMQEFAGIIQSKVIVRHGTEDFLAGYFTATAPVDIGVLTNFMKKRLTYYMVPAAMMQLEKMPMTVNGKLDTKALPEIRPMPKTKKKRVPKQSLEEKIVACFCSVLHLDSCYVEDNFFELGGTSLSASKVVMQLKADGYPIEYQDIFDYQSAEELADHLEMLQAQNAKTQLTEQAAEEQTENPFHSLLQYNTMEYAAQVKREPLGDVLLTGATGFLGIHVFKALLENETGRIICLMRKGNHPDVMTHLKTMLIYYFEDEFIAAFQQRVVVLEGDITDDHLQEKLKDVAFDTLINCAASVKHYAKDQSIYFVNVHGVENLIALCKAKSAKMIQISTVSVPGAHRDETYKLNLKMTEDTLFVIDDMNNQYIQSKYQAELKMLEAIRDGLKGKIIRVGNLMGRYSDGEFQTNMRSNAFINGLRGFVSIGKCPISHSTDPMKLSPVDCTAQAIVLLAGTNDQFTAFHAESRLTFDEMKIIDSVNRCGISVKPVDDAEYYADFYRMMQDTKMNEKVSALLTNDRPDLHMVEVDNRFTANVLYRLGFAWPFIDDTYLEKVITSLDTLDFFHIN